MANNNWVYRTPTEAGYHKVITRENSELQYISYHRLILSPGDSIGLESNEQEICILCLHGEARVIVEHESGELKEKDGMYIPSQSPFAIQNQGQKTLDCVLALAPSQNKTRPVFISFQKVDNNPEQHKIIGKGVYQRDVYIMVGLEVEASRLLVGYTIGQPGQWTSWPPHEHADTQEEIYVYYGPSEKGFSIQLIYTSPNQVQVCQPIYSGDAVAIPRGYHPTVCIPGHASIYTWMIAAKNLRDRRTNVARTQPEFSRQGTAVL